eukprot:m.162471 g.162471  ORF g.162471 m.162471 type:complete len:323 (+) comp14606_c0_seq3:42-1010(+)
MAGMKIDDSGLVAAVQANRGGYALVELGPDETAALQKLLTAASHFFGSAPDVKGKAKGTSKFGYKASAVKERVQFRLPGCPRGAVAKAMLSDVSLEEAAAVAPPNKADFGEFQTDLVEGALLLRRLAARAIATLLQGTGLNVDAVLEACAAESSSSPSVSVLNIYKYFNGDGGHGEPDARNCPEHTDPGFVSVLAKGTADGLQIATGRPYDVACCTGLTAFHGADGADPSIEVGPAAESLEWVTIEPMMQPNQIVVLVGESLRRLTGGALPACLHRVVQNEARQERMNAIYELRPSVNIFQDWAAMSETAAKAPPCLELTSS